MWVFGYGSLMWDGWEKEYGGTRIDSAVLPGYERSFNKKSTRNWGSRAEPCPTLGLDQNENAECVGCAFSFPEDQKDGVLEYLRKREGPSFNLETVQVELPDNRTVGAYTAVNDSSRWTYIDESSPEKIAEMIQQAVGEDGECLDYVAKLREKLRSLSIQDDAVEKVWDAVQR